MLINEAKWLGGEAGKISNFEIGRVLDLGSGNLFLRNIRQYWINKYIFGPLKNRGIDIVHSDSELDVVSYDFIKKVGKMGSFKTVFACNLLEHLSDVKKATKNIISIVSPGGYLFVSCPKDFPYHPDPIDNMQRPSVNELINMFPGFKVISKKLVTEKMYINFNRYSGLHLNKVFSASCLVLKKRRS